MKIFNKLTLFFMCFGMLAGLMSGVISASQGATSYGVYIPILLAIFFFYVAYKSAVPSLKIMLDQFPGGRRKIATYGIWPYLAMWLILWIAVYTYAIALQLF